jgi:hypothetical protein
MGKAATGKQTPSSKQQTAQTPKAEEPPAPAPEPATAAQSPVKETPFDENNMLRFFVRVRQARNIRGSKGEKSNSFVRIQFADFAAKDVCLLRRSDRYSFR